MTFATLRALHAIIGTALDDIERVYRDASAASPAAFNVAPSPAPVAAPVPPSTPRTYVSPYPSPTSPTAPFTPSRHARDDSIPNSNPDHYDYSAPLASPFSPRSRTRSQPRASRPPPILTSIPMPRPASSPRSVEPRTPPSPSSSYTCFTSPQNSPSATHTIAMDYPSLDLPYYPPPPSSEDDDGLGERVCGMDADAEDARTRAEALTSHPVVIAATNRIVAACGQMTASVQRPFLTLCDAAMGYHLPACLRVLEASHTVEILRVAGPRGLHVRELSRRINEMRRSQRQPDEEEVNMDPAQLSHILRLLATHHIMREVRPDVFANNRVSAAMDSGHGCAEIWDAPHKKYEGTNGIAAFVGLCTDELFKNSAYLADCYLPSSHIPDISLHTSPLDFSQQCYIAPQLASAKSLNNINHRSNPNTTVSPRPRMHAPFNLAFRTNAPYFEWLERPGNAARLRRFGRAMTGTGAWEVPGAIIDGFPWNELPQDAIVVDVGGGIGSTSMLLARTFSHLRFLVQDRPQVVAMGEAAWQARCPELLSTGRAAFQAHDFFTPQPPWPSVFRTSMTGPEQYEFWEGAGLGRGHAAPAVFLLRVVTHDWPDVYVARILLHLRRAAAPHTRLLLADHILPLACVDEDSDAEDEPGGAYRKRKAPLPGTVRTLAPEGSPLLPNLGKANANAYWLDLTMQVTFNAQERTLREIAALALSAGWRIIQVTRAEGSLFGHIVAVPVEIPPGAFALLDPPPPTAAQVQVTVKREDARPTNGNRTTGVACVPHVDFPPSSEDVARAGLRGPAVDPARADGPRRKGSATLREGRAEGAGANLLLPVVVLDAAPAATSRAGRSEGRSAGMKALRRVLSRVQLGGTARADKQREGKE
ncbi:hypothetical protein B0H21DRAFT_520593 [Amylocystis lapponica]|nr:hypothetical protein B0H21DRAFT_520593 [Amylocystis lapponica]